MIALYTHATGCFVRDSVDPDYTYTFPFYSTDHCLGYESWRFIIWVGILVSVIRLRNEYAKLNQVKCWRADSSTLANASIGSTALVSPHGSSESSNTLLA